MMMRCCDSGKDGSRPRAQEVSWVGEHKILAAPGKRAQITRMRAAQTRFMEPLVASMAHS
jgi:hypothetical protein